MQPGQSRWKWFSIAITALFIIVGAAFFVQQTGIWLEAYRPTLLWQSTENDVFTKIEIRKYPSGQMELLGTFIPTRKHFHLYSKDLPKSGLNGLGRPTLLEVVSSDGIRLAGSLTAYQSTNDIYIKTLGLSFPVYPEDPVMLGLPFEIVIKDHSASIELSITYMACSDQTCLPPVIDKRFTVKMPDNIFQQH